ncbi:heteromeric transposase endonuclease subunit TnsA [Vibrio cholerae]|uniref:TnsA endonuclease C-terminal domain-containing protein n=1 Tax=Vibrio cholerae TaxID=666 RepID=UPI001A187A47|nr:TnsA endonuclease C-terminal domain-containing protein [Vibrio cholerae]EGQ7789049.1 heteromeric transposase endonuclease subunit TnsA [Vibrio cholerae]EGR0263236.1 heteromeric transposase endonuclease subunit TnsA [Vibrio cholerae]EGR0785452.1 heteromeric transposase endonuclease subunit TnsA [Vibrio cholerae]EGR1129478.1 heteromeric transposase endonuclease subunit TnsA [Vibrio cholerae]EII2378418.1 heteromeric transposase endonuclease subunit TnsA [Vibrio cholerae]
MAKNKYSASETRYGRWLKEGRGSGRGVDYQPWLTVRDVPSEGRSHRVFGHKTQRIHHLFSDLELAIFFTLEWNPQITDIREQFPLERSETRQIANENGIRHPADSGVDLYMSSDFLVNSLNTELPKFAIQGKYAEALQDPRVVEKLEIERRYWVLKKIPWFLVTEKDISPVMVRNIGWLYPSQRDELTDELLLERTAYYSAQFELYPNRTVVDLCKHLDVSYRLPEGQSLYEIRQLLAQRCFHFDMTTEFHRLLVKDLQLENMNHLIGARHVSNQ